MKRESGGSAPAGAVGAGERAALGDSASRDGELERLRLENEALREENARLRERAAAAPARSGTLPAAPQALKASEARFRGLAESSLLGLAVVSAGDPARLLYVNRAFKDMFGFEPGADPRDLQPLDVLVAPHDRARIDGYRAARRAGVPAPAEYEYDGRRVDGEPLRLRAHVGALEEPWDGVPAIMLGLVDVTAQRGAERALRESERRFRDFAEAASDWYWEMDAGYRVTYVSERFETVTGVPVDEVIGLTREEILTGALPPEEVAQEQKWRRFRETLEAHRGYRDFVYRWVDPTGRTRTLSSSALPILDADGTFRGYRGIGRDVTMEADTRRALEDERERLARAEATAQLGNWEWRVATGEVFWSHEMYRIAGLDPARFRVDDENAISVIHARDAGAVRDALRWCMKTAAPIAFHARVVRPDGCTRRVEVTAECETDHTGRVAVIHGVVQDVTERDRAQALLRDAIESIPDGFAIYDADDRLTLFNEAYREGAHGAQDLVRPGLRFEELMRAYVERGALSGPGTSDPSWVEQRLAKHRNPGPPIEVDFADGRALRVIERRTREGGTVVLRMDVTEARRAEALLRDAIESMPHAFLLWDTEDRLVMANDAFYRQDPGSTGQVVPGARFEDVMRSRVRQGLVASAHGREEAHVRERLAQHRDPTGEPIEQQFRDGRWIEIRESRTRIGGTLSFRTDITARKRAEHELARHRERLQELVAERTRELADAHAELLRSERLAAIGHVTATVSHELRNPLGTLRTSAFVLGRRLGTQREPVRRILERIDRSVDRCVAIIEELLAYTRDRPLTPQHLDLGDWCRKVLARIEPPPGVRLEVDARGNPPVSCDEERLRQALVNVVANAVQAVEGLPGEPRGGTVRVLVVERADCHELIVEDDGPGIAPADLDHVFEPLFSTRPFGVGLGLPVVRQAMEQHGGGVRIEPREAGGTRVVLWLPLEPVPELG